MIATIFPFPNTEKENSDILLPLQSHRFFPNYHLDKKSILSKLWLVTPLVQDSAIPYQPPDCPSSCDSCALFGATF